MVPWSNNDRDQVSNWKNLSVELFLELCWCLKTSHHTEKPDLSQIMFSITREKKRGKKYYHFRTPQNLIPHPPKELQREDHHKLEVQTVYHVVKYETTEKKAGRINETIYISAQKRYGNISLAKTMMWQFKTVYWSSLPTKITLWWLELRCSAGNL